MPSLGVRFILLSSENSINAHQLPRYAFFQALLATEPIVRMPGSILYDLYAPTTSNAVPTVDSPATGVHPRYDGNTQRLHVGRTPTFYQASGLQHTLRVR